MANIFLKMLAKNFNGIKERFKKQIQSSGLKYDQDIFEDTMLKCNDILTDESATDDEMINYFWLAFKNNTLRDLKYARNRVCASEELIEIEDEPYEEDDYDEIVKMIIDKFGVELYKLFSLHANGTSYKELINQTEYKKVEDLKYKFRQIREYIRENYKKG